MSDQSSSLVNDSASAPLWRNVARFALRPRLPARMTGMSRPALADTFKLYGFDMVLMGAVLVVFLTIEMAGVELPSNELEEIDLGLQWIALIVLGAPIAEEVVFRGWLSGRPGAVWPVALMLFAFLLSGTITAGMGAAEGAGFMLASVAVAGVLAYVWNSKPPHRWFVRAFPLFFWASALGFAAIHLGNYADTEEMLWPLVIPQFLAGILFAYARVHHGLWSSILLHALHNGTFIALVLMGEVLGGV